MVESPSMVASLLRAKHKAIAALSPYAVRLEQGGQHEMVDAIFRAARASGLTLQWSHIKTHITVLFGESSPPFMNRAIALMSPYVSPLFGLDTKNHLARWAAAALAVPYSEEVCQSVVNTLLQISCNDSLRLHIPVGVWAWLNKRPSLPPSYPGRLSASQSAVVRHVRGLGDVEILKSFFLVVWSEWNSAYGIDEMEISIQTVFGGIEMWCHRDGLIKRLDHVQKQLDRGLEYIKQHQPWIFQRNIKMRKEGYSRLKNVLLEVDKIAMESALTRTPPSLTLFDQRNNLLGCVQDPTLTLPVLCLPLVCNFAFSTVDVTSRAGFQCFSRWPLFGSW